MFDHTWYSFGRSMANLYARLMLKTDVAWYAPLPEGPKIIAANHPTTIDPALIMLLGSEKMSIVIDGALFEAPVLGGYLRRAGHIPVPHENRRFAFEEARRLLEAGQTVAIFPEGHVSPPQGRFHEPCTGTARLALSTGAAVIPVGIHLQQDRVRRVEHKVAGMSAVATWYSRGPYVMMVGEPLHFEGDVQDRPFVQSISEHIMQRIIHLSYEGARRLEVSPALAVGTA